MLMKMMRTTMIALEEGEHPLHSLRPDRQRLSQNAHGSRQRLSKLKAERFYRSRLRGLSAAAIAGNAFRLIGMDKGDEAEQAATRHHVVYRNLKHTASTALAYRASAAA